MNQKHEYIKKLYKEWDLKALENEIKEIKEINFKYNKDLSSNLNINIKKIQKNIQDNEKLIKFIEKVRCLLIKNLNNKK